MCFIDFMHSDLMYRDYPNQSVMNIDNVNATHDGTYQCKARNQFGEQQVKFYVTITGE